MLFSQPVRPDEAFDLSFPDIESDIGKGSQPTEVLTHAVKLKHVSSFPLR